MSSKADRLAMKGILAMALFAALLALARFAFPPLLAEIAAWKPSPPAQSVAPPAPAWHPSAPAPAPQFYTEATPPPLPRSLTLRLVPRRWSQTIEVPDGLTASVTFTLGRVRIERNGLDEGVCFRQPVAVQGPGGRIVLRPFAALLDKSPRTVTFGGDTRTLRLMSGEGVPGTVRVEFR